MASVTILSDNGATSGSAGLKTSGGNDGVLLLQTTTSGGTPTTAISISNTQVVTYTNQPTYTGGTANGVLYLNGSKAVTSGTALVFDGSNLLVGTTTSKARLQVTPTSNIEPPTLGAGGGSLFVSSSNALYGLYMGTQSNGNSWIQSNRNDATATAYDILLQPSGGNVGIGVAPAAKLEVQITSTSTPSLRLRYNSSSYYFDASMDPNGNAVFMSPAANGVTSGNLVFGAGGANRAYVNSNGVLTVLAGSATSAALTGLHLADNGSASYITALTSAGGARDLVLRGQNIDFQTGSSYASKMTLYDVGCLSVGSNINSSAARLILYGQTNYNTTTPGTSIGTFHFAGQTTSDYANAITWNGGTGTTGAQAGIYVQGSGSYGTRMRFATTDDYATGAKTRMTIDYNGSIGAPSGTNIYNASDRRLKQNIQPITGALNKVLQLTSVAYNWIDNFCPEENGKTLYGWVAQDVQVVDSNLVEAFGTNDIVVLGQTIKNPLRVNEKFVVPLLVKAIQELKAEVDALKGQA